jgi:hypothetical protein
MSEASFEEAGPSSWVEFLEGPVWAHPMINIKGRTAKIEGNEEDARLK